MEVKGSPSSTRLVIGRPSSNATKQMEDPVQCWVYEEETPEDY